MHQVIIFYYFQLGWGIVKIQYLKIVIIILTFPISLTFRNFFENYTDEFNSIGFYFIINWNKKHIKAPSDNYIISEYHVTMRLQSCSNGVHECIHAHSLNLQKKE